MWYLGRRMRLLLHLPRLLTRIQEEKIFVDLRRAIPKSDKWALGHNSWISAEALILIDKRVYMRQEPWQDQRRLRRLGRAIWVALKDDKRRRAAKVGEDVERLLRGDTPLPCEAWRRM